MDAFEFNKFAAALLLALLVIFGTRAISNIVIKAHKPEKPGYMVEVPDAPEQVAGKTGEAPQVPFANLLAKGNAEKGRGVAKKCAACHTFNKGGAKKIGPNLYGIFGRALGSGDGFAYSEAIKAKGGKWDYETLNQFLANPKAYIKGTKMAFAGVKKDTQRADLILFLRQQGDNKPPLPDVKAQATEETRAAASPAPEKPAMVTPASPAPEKPAAMSSPGDDSLGARLAKGDAARGQEVSAKCGMCHTFDNGGKNKIGPNLYGIVGREVGSKPDFEYSDAVKTRGGNWTFEQLDCFITSPKKCVPGTRMPFPGLPDAAARADLLAFLRTLSDSPVPLPAP